MAGHGSPPAKNQAENPNRKVYQFNGPRMAASGRGMSTNSPSPNEQRAVNRRRSLESTGGVRAPTVSRRHLHGLLRQEASWPDTITPRPDRGRDPGRQVDRSTLRRTDRDRSFRASFAGPRNEVALLPRPAEHRRPAPQGIGPCTVLMCLRGGVSAPSRGRCPATSTGRN